MYRHGKWVGLISSKSISRGAWYVILPNECQFGSGKWFWLRILVGGGGGGLRWLVKGAAAAVCTCRKECNNMI
jgi:hypothetical protein